MSLSERCKSTLFRLICEAPLPETVIFIQAGARGAAVRKAAQVLATLRQVPTTEVAVRSVASHAELVAQGSSDDEDLRIFETSWRREDGASTGSHTEVVWIRDPLFLSNDETLLATWAELMAEIAYQEAERALKKAR
ncbi:hypothetical protein [Robbsia sp. KACC 23696]|uniref:hypothetical protein n=1 Tax=Robbsia sp. KACC 23696 TaxID=3149231 RepID=UPI00325AFD84